MNELDEVKRLEKEIWDERKAVYKEALDEWWDEKFRTGGSGYSLPWRLWPWG